MCFDLASEEKRCPAFLPPLPEKDVFVDLDDVLTDAYIQADIHCMDLEILACQSSSAVLQSILSTPTTFHSWMCSKPNRKMLEKYQEAVQLCYDAVCPCAEAAGTLHITTQHCDMTATCVFHIGHQSGTHAANTEDDDFEDQSFEPDVSMILTDFAPVISNKPMKNDNMKLAPIMSKKRMKNDKMKVVMMGVGTPRCSVKNHLGNEDCNSQSQTRLAKRNILKL